MKRIVEGDLSPSEFHVGLAVAQWNQAVTSKLEAGAVSRCDQLGVRDVTVLRVPGALELPMACKALAERGCDAVVAIGTVVRGETDHYEIVVRESSAGVSGVALQTGVPVGNAILAVSDYEHALDRSGAGSANKGVEAVDAAIATALALTELNSG